LEVSYLLTNERINYLKGKGYGVPPKQKADFSDLPDSMEKAMNLKADELSYMTAQETLKQLDAVKEEVRKAV
jgi:hypothetical protein